MRKAEYETLLDAIIRNYPSTRYVNFVPLSIRARQDLQYYLHNLPTAELQQYRIRLSGPNGRAPRGNHRCERAADAGQNSVRTHSNILTVLMTDLTRCWLFTDLQATTNQTTLFKWLEWYYAQDFAQFNKACDAVYELSRRGFLETASLRQFKAAVFEQTGMPARLLLRPIWSVVEGLLLLKPEHRGVPIGFVIGQICQWTRLSARATFDNTALEAACGERFQENQDRLYRIWSSPDSEREYYLSLMKRIISHLMVDDANFRPEPGRHGSGAVAEEHSTKARLKCRYLAQKDELLSYYVKRFGIDASDDLGLYANFVSPEELSRTSRWLTVPKSLEKRRGIAPQPAVLMWYQQGILDGLYKTVWNVSEHNEEQLTPRQRYVRDHIPIFNRDVNRHLALFGSKHNLWATFDLSDASDCVTVHLVKAVFEANLRTALICCRCTRTSAHPHMETYGTMGDATVFPTESIVIAAVCQLALYLARSIDPDVNIHAYRVFGDDVVIQNRQSVIMYFNRICEVIGFKVNKDKSFTDGPYRESCGVEAYKGVEIQPWYLFNRTAPSMDRAAQVACFVSAANSLYRRGYSNTRQFFIWMLSKLCWGYDKIPFTAEGADDSRVFTPFLTDRGTFRYHQDYQVCQRQEFVVVSQDDDDDLASIWEEWYKYYLYLLNPPKRESHWDPEQFKVYEVLLRSFRNRTLHIRKVWTDVAQLQG